MHRKTRMKLTDLNPLLTCSLCKGYLIDATTLTECLHSFCRSCLVRYLQTSQSCPKCDTLVHKSRPLLNASSSRPVRSPGNLGIDRALQNIVYKLVPGLFKDEMKTRREFYSEYPQAVASASTSPGDLEDRGEVTERELVIYCDDEHMNLSLEYSMPYSLTKSTENKPCDGDSKGKRTGSDLDDEDEMVHKRYLRCPAAVCVKHIKKLIRNKFDLGPNYQIEITHVDNEEDPLPDDYTLMDVAYIYGWRRIGPLPLVFRVYQETNKKRKTVHVPKPVTVSEMESGKTPEKLTDISTDKDGEQNKEITPSEKGPEINRGNSALVTPNTTDWINGNKHEQEDRQSLQNSVEPDILERITYQVPPESNLTERHLMPQLSLTKMNIFDSSEKLCLTDDNSTTKTVMCNNVEDTSKNEGNSNTDYMVMTTDKKRLLLDEIVQEKVKVTLLNNEALINKDKTVVENGHRQSIDDLPKQLSANGVSLDTQSTISSPVVSVR